MVCIYHNGTYKQVHMKMLQRGYCDSLARARPPAGTTSGSKTGLERGSRISNRRQPLAANVTGRIVEFEINTLLRLLAVSPDGLTGSARWY